MTSNRELPAVSLEDDPKLSNMTEIEREFLYFKKYEADSKERRFQEAALQLAEKKKLQKQKQAVSDACPDTPPSTDEDDDINMDNNHPFIHPERQTIVDTEVLSSYNPQNSQQTEDQYIQHSPTSEPKKICNYPTLHEMHEVQMKRSKLEKIIFEPYFSEFIKKLYVRVFICNRRTSRNTMEPYYVIGRIVRSCKYKYPYKLSNKRTETNIALEICRASNNRIFKISVVSDRAFTNKEYNEWLDLQKSTKGAYIPTSVQLSDIYLNAVRIPKTFKYDEKALRKMRIQKHEKRDVNNVVNLHKEKMRIQSELDMLSLTANSDHIFDDYNTEKTDLSMYLREINSEIQKRKNLKNSNKLGINSINESNRRKNLKNERKARMNVGNESNLGNIGNIRQINDRNNGDIGVKRDKFIRAPTEPITESFSISNIKKNEEIDHILVENENGNEIKVKVEEMQMNIFEDFHENGSSCLALEMDDYNIAPRNSCKLIDDNVWGVIHEIAQNFCSQFIDVQLPMYKMPEPQFGRNRQISNYGEKYCKKPENIRIYSLDEYESEGKFQLS